MVGSSATYFGVESHLFPKSDNLYVSPLSRLSTTYSLIFAKKVLPPSPKNTRSEFYKSKGTAIKYFSYLGEKSPSLKLIIYAWVVPWILTVNKSKSEEMERMWAWAQSCE